LYGYPPDSQLYKRSKTGVLEVWSQLKNLGLDMTFLLEILIGTPVVEPDYGSSTDLSLVEGLKISSS
jgi:hypothetical protein